MKEMTFKINKLFNKFDYELLFPNKLNVMIGENGCGKTTILLMIKYILQNDYLSLSKIDFESLEITADDEHIIINHDDLMQSEITKSYEFRTMVCELDFNDYNSFDEFMLDLEEKAKLMDIYPNTMDYDDIDQDEYLKEDNLYYNKPNYINTMKKAKTVYGSKMYLMQFYCFMKGIEFKLLDFNVNFYSYVDLKEIDLKNIDKRAYPIINEYIMDKQYDMDKDCFVDKVTNELISFDDLSSGEKKIIQIIDMVVNTNENEILLLDEPELSLSIFWQNKLINDILEYSKASYVLIASQSPHLLSDDQIDYLVPIFVEEDNEEDSD